jgi:hypothetical protein
MGPTQEGAEGDFPACCLKSFLSPSTVPTGQVRAGQCHMAVPGTGGGRDAEGPPPKAGHSPRPGFDLSYGTPGFVGDMQEIQMSPAPCFPWSRG